MKYYLCYAALLVCIIVSLISCDKLSNELKPYSEDIEFESTISSNGNVIALVSIQQKIIIGQDSLFLTIQNPNNHAIDSMEVLVFFSSEDNFDDALNYVTKISIPQLMPFKDTIIAIYSHPELPVEQSEIKVKLIRMAGVPTNVLAGYYQYGQGSYYLPTDTVPSSYSGLKGYIENDGTTSFWMKKNGVYKKMAGQFNDTLMVSGSYLASETETNFSIELDSLLSASQKFEFTQGTVKFRIKILETPNSGTEKRIEFTLYK